MNRLRSAVEEVVVSELAGDWLDQAEWDLRPGRYRAGLPAGG